MRVLPSDWRYEAIDKVVAETFLANPRKTAPEEEFLYVEISGIDRENGIIKKYKRLLGKDAPSRARRKIRENDVLVSTVRPNLNATALVPKSLDNQICSTGFCVLRSNERVIPEYLYFFTRSPQFVKNIVSKTKGASYPAVTEDDIKQVKILIPPIETQRKIVNLLERVHTLQRKRKNANQSTTKILQAVFFQMFGDSIQNPMKWYTKRIRDVSKVVRGSSPRPKGDPRYFGGQIPRLMIADITRDGSPVYPQIDFLTEEGAKRSRPIEKGTVVMAVSGNVGLTSIVGVDCCIHDGFVGFLNLSKDINPIFLREFLESIKFINLARSSGAIWKNLTTQEIKEIEVAIPPLHLQNEFAFFSKHVENIIQKSYDSADGINKLLSTLLHKAFTGEFFS